MKTTMIDSDTIAQLAVEGIEILNEHRGYAPESADQKRDALAQLAKAGDPFRRLKGDLEYARDFLDDRRAGGDEAKRLRVSTLHEVLSAAIAAYCPET